MLQYQFDLQYTKGEDNPVADFLSRNAKEGEWIEEGQAISAINVTREEMKLAQDQDDKMIAVKKFLRMDDSQRKLQDKQIQNLGENCFETDDGILMKELEVNARRRTALWPPTKIRKNIIEAAHLSKDAGHGGKDRTINRIKLGYWRPREGVQQRSITRNLYTVGHRQEKNKPLSSTNKFKRRKL